VFLKVKQEASTLYSEIKKITTVKMMLLMEKRKLLISLIS
jgi:hypothetical protein